MDVIRRILSALLVLTLLTAFENAFAQSKPNASASQRPLNGVHFYFDKPVTLDSLTRYVHSRSKIRFSFNSTKVKGAQMIDLEKGVYTIDQLLQQVRKNTSLYYAVRNGYVIFQDNPPKLKTTPAVAKTNPAKPSVKKKAIASSPKPVQLPAKTLQPEPVVQAPQADTVKKTTDSTRTPDSIKVLLPLTAQAQTRNNDDDAEVAYNRRLLPGKLHLSFGRKPIDTTIIDTTIIDTLQKKDPPPTAKPATTPVVAKKKEREKRSAAPARIYYDVGTAWSWQYGLQWKATIPLNGSKYYFTGTNNRSEPYNLLIPGIWLSTTVNNTHELMLLVKPAEWYFYDKKNYRKDTTELIDHSDSIIKIVTRRKTGTLIKTGGWYGSLQYNYHINENWLVGAGIGYHLRVGALAYQQTYKNLSDTLVSDSSYSMQKNSDTDKYLASSFITGKLELAYHFKALDIGATVLLPLTDPFADKSLNKSRPLNVQLFVRWRIKRNEDE
jgi:hypothetical protein